MEDRQQANKQLQQKPSFLNSHFRKKNVLRKKKKKKKKKGPFNRIERSVDRSKRCNMFKLIDKSSKNLWAIFHWKLVVIGHIAIVYNALLHIFKA
ncbi:hypothetical protein BLOT_014131 [Blomia tropicalis]|nr:hypothetical protein BLOT_014131 [Blomia tropicalis]